MLWIEVHDGIADAKLGSGPITSASSFRYTASLSRAGEFSFHMPATDEKASLIQKKRVVRAYSVLGDVRTLVGAGVVDDIQRQPLSDGSVILRVSGSDLLKELTYRSVLRLKLYDNGLPVAHATALSAVAAFAPPGWTMTPDGAPPNALIYGQFNNESVLAALIKIAEKSQNQFVGGLDRSVTFASAFTPSGVRAIQSTQDLAPETCAITSLTEIENTHQLMTRIYPRGSGNADVQTTLRATNRTAPAGYTLNAAQNYIEANAATAAYGRIEKAVNYREIGPVANTDADIQAAANALFDAALETLKRHSIEMEQASYRLAVAECSQMLRPLQTIRVAYRDLDAGLDINQDLNILSATWEADASGVRTTGLVVSTHDRQATGDAAALVDGMENSALYQALPQLNANSYTTGYTVHLDDSETGVIDFDLGDEVTQVNQILLRFRLKPFESTVKSVGGTSGGSGTIPTTGPSTNTSGNPSNDTSGSPSTNTSGSASGSTGVPSTNTSGLPSVNESGHSGSGPTAGPSNNTSGTATGNTGSGGSGATSNAVGTTGDGGSGNTGDGGSGSTGNATGNTGNATGDTGSGGGGSTDSSGSGNTGNPSGGDSSGGQHAHLIGIGHDSGGVPVFFKAGGSGSSLYIESGSAGGVPTNPAGTHVHDRGNHTHSLGGHSHTISDHSHSLNSHTHSLGNHSHSLGSHNHGLGSHNHSLGDHNHTLGSHTHNLGSHTHDLGSHTHLMGLHTHTLGNHTHDMGAHTHSLNSHTHSLNNHTHSLGNHTHDLSESISALYGIFRESLANTYVLANLEYRVNSGAWLSLDTAAAISGGRFELDLTIQVVNATTLRQLSDFNTVSFRRKAAAPANKTVQIAAQLKVRTVIQAIAIV